MTARNRHGFERGQAVRAEIRAIMLNHPSGAEPLTWKNIAPRLSQPLSERTIQWHMREIRSEGATLNVAVVADAAMYSRATVSDAKTHADTERSTDFPPPRLAYSVDEAVALMGLSRSTLYRMIQAGTLRTVRYGRRRLVPATELDRLL